MRTVRPANRLWIPSPPSRFVPRPHHTPHSANPATHPISEPLYFAYYRHEQRMRLCSASTRTENAATHYDVLPSTRVARLAAGPFNFNRSPTRPASRIPSPSYLNLIPSTPSPRLVTPVSAASSADLLHEPPPCSPSPCATLSARCQRVAPSPLKASRYCTERSALPSTHLCVTHGTNAFHALGNAPHTHV